MADPSARSAGSRRARVQLLGLFLVFFVPVLAALWLNVEHAGWMPFGTINHGELVRPPLQLDADRLRSAEGAPIAAGVLRERWTLLVVTGQSCDAACRQVLLDTHRVRRGLGKDMGRVQRLVVVQTDAGVLDLEALRRAQPDLQVAVAGRGWLETALAPLRPGAGALFLVDPQGFVVLRYALDADPRGLLDDLERLLRISKIG